MIYMSNVLAFANARDENLGYLVFEICQLDSLDLTMITPKGSPFWVSWKALIKVFTSIEIMSK